eukprot:1568314-Alexandrium_andersonii.AAC.1
MTVRCPEARPLIAWAPPGAWADRGRAPRADPWRGSGAPGNRASGSGAAAGVWRPPPEKPASDGAA